MRLLSSLVVASALIFLPSPSYAKDAKLSGQQVVAIADISVGLSGLICDFCSIALNKTFNRRAEVKGSYVDLDTKTLSIALKTDAELSNDQVMALVKKSGYATTKIKRKDGSEFIPTDKN